MKNSELKGGDIFSSKEGEIYMFVDLEALYIYTDDVLFLQQILL
jgi:hypothetical protein